MKRKITKVLGMILLFMIAFNTFCYADEIVPMNPRGRGLGALKRSQEGSDNNIAIIFLSVGIVVAIVLVAAIILSQSKKKDGNNSDK